MKLKAAAKAKEEAERMKLEEEEAELKRLEEEEAELKRLMEEEDRLKVSEEEEAQRHHSEREAFAAEQTDSVSLWGDWDLGVSSSKKKKKKKKVAEEARPLPLPSAPELESMIGDIPVATDIITAT
ncbi:hypothetical protein SVAN01_11868 [Stagonosporopsis vannaccii]|nr:hypothetical protein SVAN01_11868 [Stagonosporopsis vannaccii]